MVDDWIAYSRDLDTLNKKGIEVVRGEIQKVDPEAKKVIVDGISHSGD